MKFKKSVSSTLAMAIIMGSMSGLSFADSSRIVTLGENLKPEQKQTMLKYFGVNENEVEVVSVNNQEERKYLEGIADESQVGTKTYSCAYIEPTSSGSGVNVKTANLTWVTSSMIASTLATAGVTDANVLAAAPFKVSGTGALTGVFKAYEQTTGETLSEEKKEIATEEIVVTGELGETVGQEKATGIVNDIKADVIKNNTKDTTQIAETINNVTNNYNVMLTDAQKQTLNDMMVKVAEQDYDYKEMKSTFENVTKDVEGKLEALGESLPSKGFWDGIGNFFTGIGEAITGVFKNEEKEMGILATTNDNALGSSAVIDATNSEVIQNAKEEAQGFFDKVVSWVKSLFNKEETTSLDKIDDTTQTTEEELTPEEQKVQEEIDKAMEQDLEGPSAEEESQVDPTAGLEDVGPGYYNEDIPVQGMEATE